MSLYNLEWKYLGNRYFKFLYFYFNIIINILLLKINMLNIRVVNYYCFCCYYVEIRKDWDICKEFFIFEFKKCIIFLILIVKNIFFFRVKYVIF